MISGTTTLQSIALISHHVRHGEYNTGNHSNAGFCTLKWDQKLALLAQATTQAQFQASDGGYCERETGYQERFRLETKNKYYSYR